MSDLWLPTTGIHLEHSESMGPFTDWIRHIAIGDEFAIMRAHEFRGPKFTLRTLNITVTVPTVRVVRATGRDWDELEHRLRARARLQGLEHAFTSFIYQQRAVA